MTTFKVAHVITMTVLYDAKDEAEALSQAHGACGTATVIDLLEDAIDVDMGPVNLVRE